MSNRRIIGIGQPDIPGPTAEQVAAKLKSMSTGQRVVTTQQLASALNCRVGAVQHELNIARQLGMVRQIPGEWIAD